MGRAGRSHWFDRNTALLAVSLAALGALVIVATVVDPPASGSVGFETRRLLVQFLLLVAGGGLITTWLDRLRERRTVQELQRNYRAQAVRSLIDGLDHMYTKVKLERRKLRTYPASEFPRDYFEVVANTVSTLQVEAELLKRNAVALASRLPEIEPLSATCRTSTTTSPGSRDERSRYCARRPTGRRSI